MSPAYRLPEVGTAALKIDGVSQTYQSASGPVHALDNVSFEIEQGKFIGLVGPSGCGKSSLLMMMAGLLAPTDGHISVGERKITRPEPEQIGVVFQESSLLPWKTALENVAFPLELRGIDRAESTSLARKMLDRVGLGEFMNRRPHELSGGMKQRVAIARGFCQNPRVLLMDEPFAALDEQTRLTLGDELLAIWEEHRKTVVFVTHSLTEAVYLCDEVVIMGARPGRVLKRLVIDLPRPRTYKMMATQRFGELRDEIWELIRTMEHA
jgi:NitT/TauT family transport system ATP-binding protein